jgi:uncharacterized membrane protein YdjX (TVP38/TMEM64 family)
MSFQEERFPGSYDSVEDGNSSRFVQFKQKITDVSYQTLDTFNNQPAWRKAVVITAGILVSILGLFIIIYRDAVFEYIVETSDKWSVNPWTPFVLVAFIFLTAFPPIIGFAFSSTVVGIVYGVTFKGWFIIAFASVTGSVSAFLVFRFFLKSRAEALVSSNEKLFALSSVLKDNNSYWILALIRVCPLPYSLTNGALAGIPGVSPLHFALGSIISSPKLLMYLFVGQKIKNIGETSDTMKKLVDFLSIALTFVFLAVTGYVLFAKTNRRLREIENQRMVESERYSTTRLLDDEFELDDELDQERI